MKKFTKNAGCIHPNKGLHFDQPLAACPYHATPSTTPFQRKTVAIKRPFRASPAMFSNGKR